MNRTLAREQVFKIIYEMDLNDMLKEEHVTKYLIDNDLGDQYTYGYKLIMTLIENINDIDDLIDSKSINWKVNRMNKIDLAILRLSTIEIKYFDDIPKAVSINCAVDLAKKYGDKDSYKFVNAVLGKIE